ncbi:MAG: glycine betaine ABC transporter substrate-binding protein [Methanosarcinaceae archaeon]|nr:glycine betaine ABC transporter substrate-binding protein [Methanosarcinaceae archaeon]
MKIDTIGNLKNNFGKKIGSILIVSFVLGICLFGAGCADKNDSKAGGGPPDAGPGSEYEDEITIGYVLWDGEIASTNVIQQVLQQAGYKNVEIMHVDAGPLYHGLAKGEFDFTTSAWLPQTHIHYWEKYGDQIDPVGINLKNCRIGLVVPPYVEVSSIEELNANKELFEGEIIGIDPGAGVMDLTETAIDEYGLDMELTASSNMGMAAALELAIESKEPVVVTLWSPHWAFNRWDLEYLEDPKGVYGKSDNAETLARKGLKEDMPKLYSILERFEWNHDDIESVMMDIENDTAPDEAAAKWIENNPDKVQEWIGEE